MRWQAGTIEALQQITEATMIELFEGAQIAAIHAKRTTIIPEDIVLAVSLFHDGCEVLMD